MKLLNNLYTILSSGGDGTSVSYSVTLNPDCFIYKAHFPGMPITPGVCIIQIVNELLGFAAGYELRIAGVKNAKFLSVLVPDTKPIDITISNIKIIDDIISAQALVAGQDGVNYAKISLQAINA